MSILGWGNRTTPRPLKNTEMVLEVSDFFGVARVMTFGVSRDGFGDASFVEKGPNDIKCVAVFDVQSFVETNDPRVSNLQTEELFFWEGGGGIHRTRTT